MTQWAPVPLWLWGIIICVFATALTALGLVLQKLSHTLNAQKPRNDEKAVYYKQPWWLAGFSIFAVAQIINLVSMAMAPQVMLSCLGATALIFNAVFAWWILGEELHFFEVGLIFGMVFSVTMVISTTPVIDTNPTAGNVLNDSVGPLFEFRFLALGAGLLAILTFLRFAVIDSALAKRVPDLAPVTWTLCSAVASGYTVNLFKASSEVIMSWPETRPLLHWECYVVLAGAFGFGAVQVHFLNCALNLGTAMMVVPTYFSLALLAQLGISEAIAVDVPETPLKVALFICGIALILVFIVLFVRAKIAYEEQPDADFEEVFDIAVKSWPSSPTKAGSGFQSWPSSPTKAASEESKLLPDAPSTPPHVGSPFLMRERSLSMQSGYDCDAFQDSFQGRERTYTVSVIGLGIA